MKRDPDYRRYVADHLPADRTPYHGEPEADMLDLDRLEQQAGEELHQPEDDSILDLDLLDAALAAEDDFFEADTVLDEDFALDDRLTLCFTCSVCRIVPVDPLKGQVTCSWCLSRS